MPYKNIRTSLIGGSPIAVSRFTYGDERLI